MPVSKKRKRKKKKRKITNILKSNQSYNIQQHNAQQSSIDSQMLDRLNSKGYNMSYEKGRHKDSVSALICEFGEDILDMCEDEKDYKKFASILIMAWNLGHFNEEEKEHSFAEMSKLMNPAEFRDIIDMLVARKKLYYDEYKYFVMEYDITMVGGKPNLSVASVNLD